MSVAFLLEAEEAAAAAEEEWPFLPLRLLESSAPSSASFSSSGAQCSSVWIAGLDFRRRCWLLGFTAKPATPAAAAADSGSLDGDLRGRPILISTNQLLHEGETYQAYCPSPRSGWL